MTEILNMIIALIVLALGFPLGNYMAKYTKEELKGGQLWFKLIILFSFLGAVISIFLRNDALLFSLLFIAIVTSRSLKTRKNNSKKKK